jgi:hypothetical protein
MFFLETRSSHHSNSSVWETAKTDSFFCHVLQVTKIKQNFQSSPLCTVNVGPEKSPKS